MSNESFWKRLQTTMCPPDKQPPSVWTMMFVVILLGGVVAWLFGMPWQAAIPVTLVIMLFALGGQQLGKRISKKGYEIQPDPPRKAMSPWATFWMMMLFIVMIFAIRLPLGLAERYAWPDWSVLAMCGTGVLIGFIGVIASIYLFRKSKKQSRKQQTKEMNMNEGPLKPANNPDEQERKRRALKVMIPSMCLGIAGLGLWVLSFSLDVSRTVSIFMMTIGGLCWGISGALSLKVILTAIQMQRQGTPSQKQLQKNQFKIKWLSIAVILLFTAVVFIASLFIFNNGG